MGDRKAPYTPKYEPIRDDVIGKVFAACSVRQCPEPHVIARYGLGGIANVSVWTCKKCRYVIKTPFCGALGCGYGLEQNVQAGEESDS